jgi:arsenate reductase
VKKVIFVCIHNSGRSQMAEAFANRLGKGILEAESAGTIPGGNLNTVAVKAMEELGYDMSAHYPKLMTEDMVQSADKIISMGCGVDASACPVRFLVTEDWGLDDPKGQSLEKVREIRDAIQHKVEELVHLYRDASK